MDLICKGTTSFQVSHTITDVMHGMLKLSNMCCDVYGTKKDDRAVRVKDKWLIVRIILL